MNGKRQKTMRDAVLAAVAGHGAVHISSFPPESGELKAIAYERGGNHQGRTVRFPSGGVFRYVVEKANDLFPRAARGTRYVSSPSWPEWERWPESAESEGK